MNDEPKPGRLTAAFQVIVCCGQIPTQTPIVAGLLMLGVTPYVNDQVTLPFFAALTLIDTVLVVLLMLTFLSAGNESPRAVFFGARALKREAALGIIFTPLALFGAIGLVAGLRALMPNLHNVTISPFDAFFDTPGHALLFTFVAVVAGGIREELQRGFLLHRFDQSLGGAWVGLTIFSVLFGAAHIEQGYDVAIATGLLGLFWGWLYVKRRSVVAAMVSHAGFNGTQILQQMALRMIGQ